MAKKNKKIFKLDNKTRNLFVLFDQTRDILIHAIEIEMKQAEINFPQSRIVFILTQRRSGMTQKEMAGSLLRKLNSISILINKMEKQGLVRKKKSEKDKKVYVTLTRKGLGVWERINERAIYLTFSALTDEEKEQFRFLLRKLRAKTRDILNLDIKPAFLVE